MGWQDAAVFVVVVVIGLWIWRRRREAKLEKAPSAGDPPNDDHRL